jgi:hypothetical protein
MDRAHDDHRMGIAWLRDDSDRNIFRQLSYACVFAVGSGDGEPLRVSWCLHPDKRLADLQDGNWKPLQIHHIIWTAGQPLARRLEKSLHEVLDRQKLRLSGEWFDINQSAIANLMQASADSSGVPVFSHDEMLRRVRFIREERLLKAMQGYV